MELQFQTDETSIAYSRAGLRAFSCAGVQAFLVILNGEVKDLYTLALCIQTLPFALLEYQQE